MCRWRHILPLLEKKANSVYWTEFTQTRMSLFIDRNYFGLLSVFTIYRVINQLPQSQNQIIQQSLLYALHGFPLKHSVFHFVLFPLQYPIPKATIPSVTTYYQQKEVQIHQVPNSHFSFSLFQCFLLCSPGTLKLYFIQPLFPNSTNLSSPR